MDHNLLKHHLCPCQDQPPWSLSRPLATQESEMPWGEDTKKDTKIRVSSKNVLWSRYLVSGKSHTGRHESARKHVTHAAIDTNCHAQTRSQVSRNLSKGRQRLTPFHRHELPWTDMFDRHELTCFHWHELPCVAMNCHVFMSSYCFRDMIALFTGMNCHELPCFHVQLLFSGYDRSPGMKWHVFMSPTGMFSFRRSVGFGWSLKRRMPYPSKYIMDMMHITENQISTECKHRSTPQKEIELIIWFGLVLFFAVPGAKTLWYTPKVNILNQPLEDSYKMSARPESSESDPSSWNDIPESGRISSPLDVCCLMCSFMSCPTWAWRRRCQRNLGAYNGEACHGKPKNNLSHKSMVLFWF